MGAKVVEYTYDAWGKPLSKTGTMADTLGTVQPFRYRGYVWDEETGLYYLRSRYYNPVLCRFINADAILDSINLYGYCMDDPINYYDENGELLIKNRRISFVAVDNFVFYNDEGIPYYQYRVARGSLINYLPYNEYKYIKGKKYYRALLWAKMVLE